MAKKPLDDAKLLHLFFDAGLLRSVDKFRYKNHFPTRSEAVRWLVREALREKLTPPPPEERSEK